MHHPHADEPIQTLTETAKRTTLVMTIVRMGNDLCVSLFGGDTPHIGAQALAVPHPGLRDAAKTDASVSILAVTGHKEDELARKVAYELATACNCTVSVACGIHIHNATKPEIEDILQQADILLGKAQKILRKRT